MGAGKPVVSTPYAYAREILDAGRGVLVPPGSPVALADAFTTLLGDRTLRAAIGARAYRYSRAMVWSTVGSAHRRLFERVVRRGPMVGVPVHVDSRVAAGA
jgi:glycosyltransferase involved in cell wall biosynthesis